MSVQFSYVALYRVRAFRQPVIALVVGRQNSADKKTTSLRYAVGGADVIARRPGSEKSGPSNVIVERCKEGKGTPSDRVQAFSLIVSEMELSAHLQLLFIARRRR